MAFDGPVVEPAALGLHAVGSYGVALVVVPELSTALLLLAGLAALALGRRRV